MPREMRWDCNHGGVGANCFNLKCRPKFGVFDGLFPRGINFSDVDGIIEYKGYFCLLEWKMDGGSVVGGQRQAYEAFAKNKNIVFFVIGDAEAMTVKSFGYFYNGLYHEAKVATLDDFKSALLWWKRSVEIV